MHAKNTSVSIWLFNEESNISSLTWTRTKIVSVLSFNSWNNGRAGQHTFSPSGIFFSGTIPRGANDTEISALFQITLVSISTFHASTFIHICCSEDDYWRKRCLRCRTVVLTHSRAPQDPKTLRNSAFLEAQSLKKTFLEIHFGWNMGKVTRQ